MMNRILIGLILFFSLEGYSQQSQVQDSPAKVEVSVTDFKKKPRGKETIIFKAQKSKKVYEQTADDSGKFSISLPKGESYDISYKGFLGTKASSTIKIPDSKGEMTFELKIQIEEEEGKTYTLEDVFFDTGKATLRPESNKALDVLVEAMKENPTLEIEIAGHTDNVGTSESNRLLSQSRAESVRMYLIKHGIKAQRLTAKGYGETEPVADNESDEGRQMNRRTEVKILKE